MATSKRAPRSGANRRSFEPPRQHEIDRSVWVRLERKPAPITLPETSFRIITNEDLGIAAPNSEGAQLRAEDFLRIMSDAWIRNRRRAT